MTTGDKSEKTFEEAFDKLGKRAFVFRLPDSKEVHGRTNGGGWVRNQPSDYIVTEDGDMYYAEVKSTFDKNKFPLKNLERGQKHAMRRQHLANGKYFVFIHRKKTDQWYKVPGGLLLDRKDSSVNWSELSPYEWSLPHE
jgi:penicillin-binding protein-related factor A (putative recombinase)